MKRTSMPWLALLVVVHLMMLVSADISGQEARFEGVSVNRSAGTAATVVDPLSDGRFLAVNASLNDLIARAYGLHSSQLLNAPNWAGSERFDIQATATSVPPEGPEGLLPAIRDLLVQQFRLRAHMESRQLSAYVLTVKQAGRLGSGMRQTQADCSAGRRTTSEDVRAIVLQGGWPPCGLVFVNVEDSPNGQRTNRVRRSAIAPRDLAIRFQTNVDGPVVDKAELVGRFDVEYTFRAANFLGAGPFLAAIDEQLGLKLERQSVAVPVLVVDSVDRPSTGN